MRLAKKLTILALGLAALALVACSRGGGQGETEFPSFVYASALSLESYRAAVALPPEVSTSIPCYCGCASSSPPHRHLRDCFIKPEGGYTDHAAGCDLCGKIALDALQAYQQGVPLKEIRAMVDAKYAEYGTPTETPPVLE